MLFRQAFDPKNKEQTTGLEHLFDGLQNIQTKITKLIPSTKQINNEEGTKCI